MSKFIFKSPFHLLLLFIFSPSINYAQNFSSQEISRWQQQANQVTIIRDNWGVPHIYGISDADVVFGLMYAQCEDNYWQLEESGIRALGICWIMKKITALM